MEYPGYSNLLSTQHTEDDTKEWIELNSCSCTSMATGKIKQNLWDRLALFMGPWKIYMELKHGGLEDDFPFQGCIGYSDSPNSRPVCMVLCHGEEYKFVELLSLSFDASPEEAPLVVVKRSLFRWVEASRWLFFFGCCWEQRCGTRLGIFCATSDIRRVS